MTKKTREEIVRWGNKMLEGRAQPAAINLQESKREDLVFTVPPSANVANIASAIMTLPGVDDIKPKRSPIGRALSGLFKKVFGRASIRLREEMNKPDDEIKKMNDIVFSELNYVMETLDQAAEAFDDDPSLKPIIEQRRESVSRRLGEFSKAYVATYSMDPQAQRAEKKAVYSSEELAQKYIEFVRLKNQTEPTQNALKEHYRISQATWSRALQERSFWEMIVGYSESSIRNLDLEKETLFNLNVLAAERVEKIRFTETRGREVLTEDWNSKSLNPSDDLNPLERTEQGIDIEREIRGMSRSKLVKVAQSMSPSLSATNLEMMDENGLRQLVVALSIS